MDAMTPFNFGKHPVRVMSDDQGNPWFAADDVCTVLGYANSRDAVAKHCQARGVAKRDTLTNGGQQELTYINEGNLYRLIVKSRKPEAAPFESWVMDEVLPSIRKTGHYSVTPKSYKESLIALVDSLEAQERAEAEVAALTTALDREFGYVSIIRASNHVGVSEKELSWHALKTAAIRMGCPPKKAPSPRYPYQLLYPIAAFVECYPQYDFARLIPDGVASIGSLIGSSDNRRKELA